MLAFAGAFDVRTLWNPSFQTKRSEPPSFIVTFGFSLLLKSTPASETGTGFGAAASAPAGKARMKAARAAMMIESSGHGCTLRDLDRKQRQPLGQALRGARLAVEHGVPRAPAQHEPAVELAR